MKVSKVFLLFLWQCKEEYFMGLLFIFCSDIVVQIVDARNPLLFRCQDLVSKLPS